ncbi:MAG: hypothetical protein SFT92_01675 [Rickettsiales bacterium]|nr:hypothetical protein [Rickettsiales bacterium]
MAHSQKILRERGNEIRFIRAVEDDKPCWFYLKLDPSKVMEYEQKIKNGDLHVREYGHIIESGWGNYPPADVVGFMIDEYEFETPPDKSA